MVTRSALKRSTLAIALLLQTANGWATITFIGEGNIPGTATDQSGLTKVLEDGVTPGNQVGGLGSAITYTGVDSFYVATPDRGPADGTTSYVDRIHTIRLGVTKGHNQGGFTITPTLVATRLMHDGRKDRSDLPGFVPQQFARRRDCVGHGRDESGDD